MVDYLGDKTKDKEAKPPGALTFAERVARDCPGCKAHHKPGEPHFHGHNHPLDEPGHGHGHRHPSPVAHSPAPLSPVHHTPLHATSPLPDDGLGSGLPPRRPFSFPEEPLSPLDDLPHRKSPSFPSHRPRLVKIPTDYEEPWTSLLDDPDLRTPDLLKKLKDHPLKGRGRAAVKALELDDIMEDMDAFGKKKRVGFGDTRPAFDHQISMDHIGSIGGHAMSAKLEHEYGAIEESSSLRMRKKNLHISETSETTKVSNY